jgi:hypothetical protein
MNTTLKEVMNMLLSEREKNVGLRRKMTKYAASRGTLRLLAGRMGWKAVKDGPSAAAFMTEQVATLRTEALRLSEHSGTPTSDPVAAMRAASLRFETLEALVAEYRKNLQQV